MKPGHRLDETVQPGFAVVNILRDDLSRNDT
jgi:hypothetical protein